MAGSNGTDLCRTTPTSRNGATGRTRIETMGLLGLHPSPVPLATIDDGIQAVRRTLPLCVFHPRCEDGGISALEQYRREWDDDKKCFRPTAYKDWTTDPADAFRYLAQAWKPAPLRRIKPPAPTGWTIPPLPESRRAASFYKHATQRNFAQQGASRMQQSPFMDPLSTTTLGAGGGWGGERGAGGG